MTIEQFKFVFEVRYIDGSVTFTSVECGDGELGLAWRMVIQRVLHLNTVESVHFLHIERKY